ncbi:MAG: V-type ATP synthase subunit D [Clostridium sp.]
MNLNTFPDKGNLILAKNSLALASQGYELMDKKRNILLRELMGLIDQAKDIQAEIDTTFTEAYKAFTESQYRAGNRFYPGYC